MLLGQVASGRVAEREAVISIRDSHKTRHRGDGVCPVLSAATIWLSYRLTGNLSGLKGDASPQCVGRGRQSPNNTAIKILTTFAICKCGLCRPVLVTYATVRQIICRA